MKQFLGILTALAVLVASAAVLYLEEIYLNNRMFTLYSAFFLATLVAWYFDFPRPDWMHMAGVQDVRTRLGRKKIPGSVHSGAAIHGLHEFKTIEMSFRAATYCEDTDKICAESFDIASEKVFIYIAIAFLLLVFPVNEHIDLENNENFSEHLSQIVKYLSSSALFALPIFWVWARCSKQNQLNRELISQDRNHTP